MYLTVLFSVLNLKNRLHTTLHNYLTKQTNSTTTKMAGAELCFELGSSRVDWAVPVSLPGWLLQPRAPGRQSVSLSGQLGNSSSYQSRQEETETTETPLAAPRGFWWIPLTSGRLFSGLVQIFLKAPQPLPKFRSKYTCPYCFQMKEAIYQKSENVLGLLHDLSMLCPPHMVQRWVHSWFYNLDFC